MDKERKFKLEMSIVDKDSFTKSRDDKWSWETSYVDVPLDDVIQAFYGMLIGATWHPATIISAFKDFADEHIDMIESDDESYSKPALSSQIYDETNK